MDRTGRVNGVFQKLLVAEKAEKIRKEAPPLPQHGPYRVIVADPPWAYEKRPLDASKLGTCPYPQMSIEQIRALPVASLAHDDTILWLWTTNSHLREAFTVLDAWGFVHKTILTWVKNKIGTGDWLRGQTEHCLLAVRGKPTVHLINQTTVLHAPAGAHSAKPDAFYELVEALCPAPRYCELFQRKLRPNGMGTAMKPDGDVNQLVRRKKTSMLMITTDLRTDGGTQPRGRLDDAVVQRYAEDMEAGLWDSQVLGADHRLLMTARTTGSRTAFTG